MPDHRAPSAINAALTSLSQSWRRGWAALGPAALLLATTHVLRDQVGSTALWAVLMVGALLWTIQAQAVAYRLALGLSPPPLAGARVTRDVPRLIAVWLLQSLLLAILTALMLTVVGAVAFGIASVGHGFLAAEPRTWTPAMGPVGRPLAGAVALAGLAGIVWVKARLGVSPAATVDRQAIQVLSAWPLTRGRVLAVVAAMAVAAAPTAALAWGLGVAGGLHTWPGALLLGLMAIGVTLPLNAGLMTYLYRRSTSD